MSGAQNIGFRGLDHIGLTVADVDAVVAYYIETFGGEVLYEMGPLDSREMPQVNNRDWTAGHIDVPDALVRCVGIRIANTLQLELYQYERPKSNREPARNFEIGGHHFALRVDDLDAATAYLKERGCTFMEGPIDPPDGPLLGSRAHYFKDPFGIQFELMEYDRMAFMTSKV